ncbi:MAG: LuxR C-terminal-related transcriptional regulator [Streptosporangiaceae bacterium]
MGPERYAAPPDRPHGIGPDRRFSAARHHACVQGHGGQPVDVGQAGRRAKRRAGASGFLVKDMALEDILTAIRVVAAGDAIIAPGVTRRLIEQFASEPRPGRKPRELTGITDREREVLRLVGLGLSNAEIAAALYITTGTAKTHVARRLTKLDARDRVQLVITAYQAGLVPT